MEFPDKSRPDKPAAAKKVNPVIPGAKPVTRPATRRFMDYMFAESPKSLAGKVGRDVIVPRLKAGFEETVRSFLSGMLWGNGGSPVNQMIKGQTMRVGGMNYSQITPSTTGLAIQANQSRTGGNYQDIVMPSQQQAEVVLANMFDLLNEYRVVTVANLYELANMSAAISDYNFGWTSLDGARISKVREGFLLELPRPVII